MNGIDFIIDTNALIAINTGLESVEHIIDFNIGIASVSEIEVLGYQGILPIDIINYKHILANCKIFDLVPEIRKIAIEIRQQHKIKTPDAIIAATAIYTGVPLISNDKGFGKIKALTHLTF